MMKTLRPNQTQPMRAWVFIFLVCLLYSVPFSHAQEIKRLLTLEEAYSLAIRTHERVVIAQDEVAKKELLPNKALTEMLPDISFYATYNRLSQDLEFEREIDGIPLDPIVTVPEEQFIGTFEVVQPIYRARVFPLREQAFQAIIGSTASYYQVTEEILFQVAQAYYEVLKTKELVRNAEEILELAEKELEVSRVKVEAGAVTEDVLLRSKLSVARARRKLIEENNNLKLANDILRRLLGLRTMNFEVVKPEEMPAMTESYDSLAAQAYDNRQDYALAISNVRLARIDKDLVKARFHPKLEASWSQHWVENPSIIEDQDFWIAAVRLKLPLFEGGVRLIELSEKQRTLHQAKLALEDLRKSIRVEVRDATLKVETQESLLDNLKEQVELAEKSYEIVFNKFQFGAATRLDLTEALTTLDATRSELIAKKYDYEILLLNVHRVTGLFVLNHIRKF